MSLTSYRAAPPRGGGWDEVRRGGAVGGPGGDLLSHALGRSTMGAAGFHGRVRDGVGWGTRAVATRSSNRPFRPRPVGDRAGAGVAAPASRHGLSLGRGCRWRGSRSIGRLGPVSCARRRASTPGLSTWWSATALVARPGLEGGFPLRCVQRLSRPNLATRLRGWRHDRSTRGSSTPVLSY
jgi:hypothetical protein